MWIILGVVAALAALVVYDVLQRSHALLHNFPIIGHFRYWLEAIGPELRQYIVTNNDEERPFSRDQRRWVYASSKRENRYFGFGTDNDLESSTPYLIIKHQTLGLAPPPGDGEGAADYPLPCAKVLGRARSRKHAFRPTSVVNLSAMSFGSLGATAIEALNRGAALARCLQVTGEGGVSPYHRHGGDLIWQIGSGYFGCRDESGRFDLERFKDVVGANPVRAIEIKLSQGAKPGAGGILPAAKVTPEIARIRGIPVGVSCHSPPVHTAFGDVDGLLDFVELLAAESGLPIGIKSAVGELEFWRDLARLMSTTDRGVDFVTIDGGEGGTGAAPLALSDHVALPFKIGFTRVFRELAACEMEKDVVFIGSGKLGFPDAALFAFGIGCDMINVGREAMLALGCIQAQRCHTGRCPAGVATQNRWLMRGVDPVLKAERVASYLATLRLELTQLSRVCGVLHPSLVTPDRLEITDDCFRSHTVEDLFEYERGWTLPSEADVREIGTLMSSGGRLRD